jgi:cellobiose-specific phosphotransferase system component IIA
MCCERISSGEINQGGNAESQALRPFSGTEGFYLFVEATQAGAVTLVNNAGQATQKANESLKYQRSKI